MLRLRFAPSPTGYLHVGGARTALFNWLYARRHGGTFILRIEDTDAERSSDAMVEGILEGMRWLGLDWDEGPIVGGPGAPYFQSQRRGIHQAMAADLLARGSAYYCYCAPETLKAKREAAEKAGGAWRYDRTCAALSAEDVAAREREGRPRAVRFRVPDGIVRFDDLVHGPIEVDAATLDDFIILRSDGLPTYHLSVVSDDVEMKTTHVVRGDDHISNTPKQVLLYRAVGAPEPRFAHVPLILATDKKRLSKRHGATSVMEYARRGYPPEAMFNFLALLGWSPGTDQEVFSREELTNVFDLGGISGGNAVFNPEKLDWFSQQHLLRLAPDDLAIRLKPWFEAQGIWDDGLLGERRGWFLAVLDLLRPRAKTLAEFPIVGRFFFTQSVDAFDEAAVARHLRVEGMAGHLAATDGALAGLESFDAASIETAVRATSDARGFKAASLIHGLRVAVTGRAASPGLFEVLALLGRERVRARIAAAIALVTVQSS
ncbi:MAG: glutamate--tRNA ligase [Vicinamibacterales bacterium]